MSKSYNSNIYRTLFTLFIINTTSFVNKCYYIMEFNSWRDIHFNFNIITMKTYP